MPSAANLPSELLNAPLPAIVEKLGLAIASAQLALDTNSITVAKTMGETVIDMAGQSRNLLELGFTPTFYAFTEATIETRLAFTITESRELGIGGSVGVNYGVFAASVNASYSRKYSFEAQGSSSIATRLVSLPAPPALLELLNQHAAASGQEQDDPPQNP